MTYNSYNCPRSSQYPHFLLVINEFVTHFSITGGHIDFLPSSPIISHHHHRQRKKEMDRNSPWWTPKSSNHRKMCLFLPPMCLQLIIIRIIIIGLISLSCLVPYKSIQLFRSTFSARVGWHWTSEWPLTAANRHWCDVLSFFSQLVLRAGLNGVHF